MARKPLSGTVAANVTEYGTGGLNIDGCRIETDEHLGRPQTDQHFFSGLQNNGYNDNSTGKGRWPANVILGCVCEGETHDADCAAAMLDAQSGERAGGGGQIAHPYQQGSVYGAKNVRSTIAHNDTGGASRFFYTAKASRSERNKGLDGMPESRSDYRPNDTGDGSFVDRLHGSNGRQNHHPTVKPLDLMQWLVRLVTPPGGTVLDPFMGSGSTMVAADREGFDGIGIELDPEYVEIARRRVFGDSPLFAEVIV